MTDLFQEEPPLKPHYPKPSRWRFINKHKDIIFVLTFFTVLVVFVSGLGEKRRIINSYEGKVFPVFQLLEHDAKTGDLTPTKIEFGEKPIIINFTASWCQHCHEQLQVLQNHYALYNHIIHVVLKEATPPKAYLESLHNTGNKVMLDTQNKLARILDINSLPTMLILDKEGRMVFRMNDTLKEEDYKKYIHKRIFPNSVASITNTAKEN